MTVPAQVEIVGAVGSIFSDRTVTPQELDWFMQFLLFAAVTIVLGSIEWEELTESYEEAMAELTTGEEAR